MIDVDQLTAWAIVGALIVSPWAVVVVPSLLVGGAVAWVVQSRRRGGLRDQRTAVARLAKLTADLDAEPARLRGVIAEERLVARLERATAAGALVRADRQQARVQALTRYVVELERQLVTEQDLRQAAEDKVTTALMELGNDWGEVEQP